jgi:serine/threonine protein kinase
MSNKIGRFEILSEISHSQAGVVYKGTDPTGNETIVLKTMKLELLGDQSTEVIKRILQETEKSKVLNSQNLAVLYGAGEIEGQFCASMEYVQGNSIATMLIRKEGFSTWDLQDIARQACQGLDHAGSHGLAHHSLEPAKIMVQWDGMVKILAFGVSRMGEYAVTAQGPAPEVLHYLSPEQIRGESIDIRSNLFTLGAMFYEMLTDKKCFDGDDSEAVRRAVAENMPAPPHRINAKIPAALSAVIMKTLAKSPDERYQTGKELLIDLEKSKTAASSSVPAAPAAKTPSRVANTASTTSLGTERNTASKAAAAGFSTAPPAGAPGNAYAPTPKNSASVASPEVPASRVVDPLKEVLVADPFSSPLQSSHQEQIRKPVFTKTGHPEKAKVDPSVIAKNAMAEIQKMPPKLFIYAIGAAIAIIFLVTIVIAFHFGSGSLDDAGTAESSRPKTVPASSVAADSAPGTLPEAIAKPEPATVTSVRPKANIKRKSKPTMAASAPVIVPGQLNVSSVPEGVQFKVDGRENPGWITPVNVTGLTPGQHTVTFAKAGYKPETRSLALSAGAKSAVIVQLESLYATVLLASEPAGAAVYMDGRDTGRLTPTQITSDKPGSHSFMFKKQGYLEGTATADLQTGQTVRVTSNLKVLGNADDIKIGGKFKKLFGGGDMAAMAAVAVKTQPKGAQVAVNRHLLDKNSPVDFHLGPGTYVVDITLSGYKDVHRVLNLEKGSKVSIDETLEPE